MEQVIIQPVSAQNWEEVIKISVSEEQKHFVPSVVKSLAYAYIKPWDEALDPFVLSLHDQIFGFFIFLTPLTLLQLLDWWISKLTKSTKERLRKKRNGRNHSISKKNSSKLQLDLISLTVEKENFIARSLCQGLGFISVPGW